MRDAKVTLIPSMSLNYEDNLLESVGIGGELYRRDTPLIAENAHLRAENERLRGIAWELYHMAMRKAGDACGACRHERDCAATCRYTDALVELGIAEEVGG